MEQQNCTFEKIQILPNNVGYLKLNSFPNTSVCRQKAVAAMASVNGADAVIFDLRDNGGGFGDMGMLIAAYLFDHPEYMYNPRENVSERNRLRAEAVKAGNWPPKIAEFIETMQSEIVVPFAFLPDLKPGKMGPYFEMRYYAMKAGTLPDLIKRWESKIEERVKMSPIALAGHVEHGEANRFIHIWAYKSLDERAAVRNKAREMGVWPPPGGSDTLLTMANKIMMPAAFSPVQ